MVISHLTRQRSRPNDGDPYEEGPNAVSQSSRRRLDDLRHFATDLGTKAGLSASRAAALARHLLWFDTAGYGRWGIATLPDWLDRIDRGLVNPRAEGKVGEEHAGTALLDGQGGLSPLILSRAAGIAVEKARDLGIGLVRVRNLGPADPSAPVVAEVAIGPMVGLIVGPQPSWSMAVPSSVGLPAVYDSALAATTSKAPSGPWTRLAPEGNWLVQAVSVAAIESLTTLQERVAAGMAEVSPVEPEGLLRPVAWESHRQEVLDHGVPVTVEHWEALMVWAKRFDVDPPAKGASNSADPV